MILRVSLVQFKNRDCKKDSFHCNKDITVIWQKSNAWLIRYCFKKFVIDLLKPVKFMLCITINPINHVIINYSLIWYIIVVSARSPQPIIFLIGLARKCDMRDKNHSRSILPPLHCSLILLPASSFSGRSNLNWFFSSNGPWFHPNLVNSFVYSLFVLNVLGYNCIGTCSSCSNSIALNLVCLIVFSDHVFIQF